MFCCSSTSLLPFFLSRSCLMQLCMVDSWRRPSLNSSPLGGGGREGGRGGGRGEGREGGMREGRGGGCTGLTYMHTYVHTVLGQEKCICISKDAKYHQPGQYPKLSTFSQSNDNSCRWYYVDIPLLVQSSQYVAPVTLTDEGNVP